MSNLLDIRKSEWKKILPLNALFFLVALNYGILRAMKNVLVVAQGGSNLISGVKLLGVIPAMFLFKYVYDTLSKRVGSNAQVYSIMGYFVVYYAVFLVWFANFRTAGLVARLAGFEEKKIWGKLWAVLPEALFYIHAEAFGTFGLGVVCWGFANRITTNQQARRYYTTLGIGAAFATILAGVLNYFKLSGVVMLSAVLLSNVLFVLIYYIFTKAMSRNPEAYDLPTKKKKKKNKLGFLASIKALFRSEDAAYLGLILGIVVFYAVDINLFEAVLNELMSQLGRSQAPVGSTRAECKVYKEAFVQRNMGIMLIAVGIVSLLVILFVANWIKKRGWRFTALTVPVVMLLGSVVFFGAFWFTNNPGGPGTWEQNHVQYLVLIVGMLIAVCVKSTKYVFLDSTKETAYLVLDERSKLEGKSAIDGVGSRFGKGGGSFMTLLLTEKWAAAFDLLSIKWVYAILILFASILWIVCVNKLSKQYEARSQALEEEEQLAKQEKVAPKAA